jgi:hypothetical protein
LVRERPRVQSSLAAPFSTDQAKMGVNRKHWKPPFDKLPSWLCPSCQSGTIVLDKDTLKCTETGISREAHGELAWEPDWIIERFLGLLVCQNASCGQLVAIGGDTEHTSNYGREEESWDRRYKPVFMHPAPPIFLIPEKCPEPVAEELRKAFALFVCQPTTDGRRGAAD